MKSLIVKNALAYATIIVAIIFSSVLAESVKIDSTTSIKDLKTFASKGNADAMLELGERLVQGQGVDTNATEGLQWIQKAADAGKVTVPGMIWDLYIPMASGSNLT